MYHLTRINTSARGKRTRGGPRRRKTRAPRNKNVAFLWLWEFKRNFRFATASAPIRPLLKSTATDKKQQEQEEILPRSTSKVLFTTSRGHSNSNWRSRVPSSKEEKLLSVLLRLTYFFSVAKSEKRACRAFSISASHTTHIHRGTLALGAAAISILRLISILMSSRVWERKGPSCPL